VSGWGTSRDMSRRGVFGHADERPYRRLTGDWVRLVLAAVLVAVSAANPQFLQAAEQGHERAAQALELLRREGKCG